jgi:hypothetical protein
MGGLRGAIRTLKRALRRGLPSFELRDGSRYYFDAAGPTLFMHYCDCITAGNPSSWPEPPEVLVKVCEARDPRAALEAVAGGSDFVPYDRDVLVNERRLEPISLIAGRDVNDQEVPDLSEP